VKLFDPDLNSRTQNEAFLEYETVEVVVTCTVGQSVALKSRAEAELTEMADRVETAKTRGRKAEVKRRARRIK
jgi:hypothetical protein